MIDVRVPRLAVSFFELVIGTDATFTHTLMGNGSVTVETGRPWR